MKAHSVEDMYTIAENIVAELTPSQGATVLGLSGDLGAGKTTFMQGVAQALGVDEPVTSPTFVIEKRYSLKNQVFEQLVHIDAYRLEDARDMAVLGWDELLQDTKNLICIEWPERIEDALPKTTRTLHFTYRGENTREVAWDI